MSPWLLVCTGGAIGSLGRHWLATWVNTQTPAGQFPWGTFVVNLLGCACGGVIAAWSDQAGWLTPSVRLFLFTGILGGFTTFSAFGLETLQLLRSGSVMLAMVYALASVAVGVGAMALTFELAR